MAMDRRDSTTTNDAGDDYSGSSGGSGSGSNHNNTADFRGKSAPVIAAATAERADDMLGVVEIGSPSYRHRFQRYKDEDVLVVDNDIVTCDLLKRYLTRIALQPGFDDDVSTLNSPSRRLEVDACTTGQQALERIRDKGKTYALVAIDLMLGPGSPSGREVVRLLREHGYRGSIIYVTAARVGADAMLVHHLLEVGADALLLKGSPNMKTEIHKIIKELAIFKKQQ
jgi:CheY-like chemotaxis protein